MTEMTPKERVMHLFNKEPIDTMPLFSGMGMVVMPGIEKVGCTFAQVHKDPEKLAYSAIWSSRLMGFDSIVIPYDMTFESEAMGNTISIYENSEDILYPTIPEKKWTSLDEVEIPEDILERGRMPFIPKAFEIIKKEAPELPIGAWQLGPYTQMGQILDLNMLLKATYKEKAKVEKVLDAVADMIIKIGKAWRAAGADYITLREMGTGSDLLSPRTWKTLIQPRIQRILEAWESPKILHICGATDPIIEMMNECGSDGLSVDIKNNLVESRKKIGDNTLLLGDFDAYDLACKPETTVEQCETAIKALIDKGVDAVWPGCDLWPVIKEENMLAIVRTTHEYGAKASLAVGRL